MAKKRKKADTMMLMPSPITPKRMMKMDAEQMARSAMRASPTFKAAENAIEKAVMQAAEGAMRKHMGNRKKAG